MKLWREPRPRPWCHRPAPWAALPAAPANEVPGYDLPPLQVSTRCAPEVQTRCRCPDTAPTHLPSFRFMPQIAG